MAGVSGCLKYSMFFFNFLFWVCGSVILGVSIWIRVSKNVQEELQIDSSLFAGVDLLIAVGSIIMVLGFLGCCGAIRESRCMLLLFFIGLLLIVILQITGGILGAVFRSQNRCCGLVNGYEDWGNNFQTLINGKQVCACEENDASNDLCISHGGRSIYKTPCVEVIAKYIDDHLLVIMGIAFGLAVIEILGLGFSMGLYCQIQRK